MKQVHNGGASRDTRTRRLETARQDRVEKEWLVDAIHEVERALAKAATRRKTAWCKTLGQSLTKLQQALVVQRHRARAEDGLLAEIVHEAPHLAPQAEALERQYDEIERRIGRFRRLVSHAEFQADTDTSSIRRRASELVGQIRDHQARETDLLYDAFATDIGVGD